MRSFFDRRPHPSFVRVPGVPRWTDLPANATEITLTPEQIEAFNESITAIIEEYEKISEQQTEGDFASPYKVLSTTFPAFQRRSKSDD